MRIDGDRIVASATDLANFLACRRKTALDLAALRGEIARPRLEDSFLEILQQRGAEHEARFVAAERDRGCEIVDLTWKDAHGNSRRGLETAEARVAATLDAMSRGVSRIVQAALVSTDGRWFGYADVLRRVERPARLGPAGTPSAWSYEALDTKLALETKGATVLQLSLYSELLAAMQGSAPEYFYVVTPAGEERYRVDEYAAYYRLVKRGLLDLLDRCPNPAPRPANPGPEPLNLALGNRTPEALAPYPEPVAHCEICDWRGECAKRLRGDDHLSFVANCSRLHRAELATHGIVTLESLGREGLPAGFRPSRGAPATYERLQHQARLQLIQRTTGRPTHECLPTEPGFGLAALPEPRPGDLFLDLEGDPFGRLGAGPETGAANREYLFGLGRFGQPGAPMTYTSRWAFNDVEERAAFEATMDDIMAALEADPDVHVYHYAAYEPTSFKRLMGRYAARDADLDRLLRGRRFIDLYAVVRRALRAGVESYSIKSMEPFYSFAREVELSTAGNQRRIIELALESGDMAAVTPAVRAAVEGYNRDDVRSTAALRDWLEGLRADLIAEKKDIPRPRMTDDKPSERVDERAQQVAILRARLLEVAPGSPLGPTLASPADPSAKAGHLLAYVLDFHRREDKAEWWDYFRLCELPESDLLDEPRAVAGLRHVGDVEAVKKSVIQRFSYPEQEIEIRAGDTLKRQDGTTFAKAVRLDRQVRTIDMLVGPTKVSFQPTALFAHRHVGADVIEDALMELGREVADAGGVEQLPPSASRSLLLRLPPALGAGSFSPPAAGEDVVSYAVSIAAGLDRTTLPIQGPPGSGKTFAGARMIEACVAAGLKVGVMGSSHKAIRNLLEEVNGPDCRIGQRCAEDDIDADGSPIRRLGNNESASDALTSGDVNVLGGTAWLWSRPEFAGAVDVLFVDEAGQVSLANVLASARAANSVVLLGDPQQLDQPTKGTHPDGVGVSALQHSLGDSETMPPERGLFLSVTWRLAPSICRFTSDMFYGGRLLSKPALARQALVPPAADRDLFSTARPAGSGLFLVQVDHHGNGNASEEEASVVADLVVSLLEPGSMWIDETGESHQVTPADIRVITPFNAQVARIRERLDSRASSSRSRLADVPVGTVDRFQGQEGAVSIYSMATSHPEEAPRGMEFLYSLNRLNVATSRARCAAILVASPRLFEPDCQTPRRMRLASVLVRFAELARS